MGGGTVGQGRGADRGRGEGGSTCLFRGSPPSQVPVCCRCHMASSVVWSLLHLQVLFDAGAATNNTIVDAWSRHTCGEVIALGRNCIGESGVVPTPTPPSYPHFPSTPPPQPSQPHYRTASRTYMVCPGPASPSNNWK